MRASVFMAGDGFARLRRRIAEIEGRSATIGATAPSPASTAGEAGRGLAPRRGGVGLAFGIDALDRRLAGGLRRNALHEMRAETTRDAAAATGFATAILSRLARFDDRPVLWVVEEAAAREGGVPHGPGLDRFGLAARRLILVTTRRPEETLWVFEEGLRCAGLAAVLAEIRGHPRVLDLTASRRLALRARESGITGFLLRQAAAPEPGASTTRWLVAPRPAGTLDDYAAGIGRPAWRLHLERNRAGATGRFDLEWDHDTCSFAPAGAASPALSLPGAAAPFDRSDLARKAGTVVAYARAS